MAILLRNQQNALRINGLSLKRRLGKVLKGIGRGTATLSVYLTDDDGIRELNLEFRGIDRSTNVLSFPSDGPPRDGGAPKGAPRGGAPKIMRDFLGDIALSAETVIKESKQHDIPVGELLYFYLIHGILHLTGHDHELGEAEEKAQEAETERLMALIPHTLP
jgi:probable rRNA maturation factor